MAGPCEQCDKFRSSIYGGEFLDLKGPQLLNKDMLAKIMGKVKLSLCLTKHNAPEDVWGSGGTAPYTNILKVDISWKQVISFRPPAA
jgi:hypothetical protein